MKKILILLFLILPKLSIAQTTITGKVVNATDKMPVPYASVFLSNSMVGGKTNIDGMFALINVKNGQYDLVISFIGFETHHQTITAAGGTLNLPDILITLKTTQLKEVIIAPDPRHDENLQLFIKLFLGRSENAGNCKILNKDIVNVRFDAATRTLNASSDDFLIIENKALGYRVKYLLNKFTQDYKNNFLYYEGSVLFENIKAKPAQQNKWLKKRLEVYKGSDMHFLRSIFANNLEEQGFRVLKLLRKPNPDRPSDSLIRTKLRLYGPVSKAHPEWQDSASFWRAKLNLPKIREYLVSKPMPLNDFAKRTDQAGMLALKYTDYLYIIYTKKANADNNGNIYHPLDMPTYPTSIIALNAAYAVFDSNGIFLDPTSTTYEGDWTGHGVADLLPVDYEPLLHP